jgi:rhamnose utilization protein RhaD (predicted bifunctional aldolase and dehydrogenase)
MAALRKSIIHYCANIGADPMLVQGAGGNVSWKENDVLWVKASGTCLAEAAVKDIFVPVELLHLQKEISRSNFAVQPELDAESKLRPSIETLLHALMPQTIVMHLHAIEILAHLVKDNFLNKFDALLEAYDDINWLNVGYYKPGSELAKAVSESLRNNHDTNVLFLQNHGVVIGGETVEEVDDILQTLISVMSTLIIRKSGVNPPILPLRINNDIKYFPVEDAAVHQLATDVAMYNRLESEWALYPDHVVFLGAFAHRYADYESFREELSGCKNSPELVFIKDTGVFVTRGFTESKLAQLRCYYDVIIRQPQEGSVNSLANEQIAELLNWDAEQYRMNMTY